MGTTPQLSKRLTNLWGLRPRRTRRSGFALVLALVLMAFLLLLTIPLATLLQVELAAATQQQRSERAKQNAWLGLNVAIGELQRNLGPDVRTSARAEILDGGSDTIQHPYWTGVWQPMLDESSPE